MNRRPNHAARGNAGKVIAFQSESAARRSSSLNVGHDMRKTLSIICLFATVLVANPDRDVGPRDSRVIASPDGGHFLLVTPVSERRQHWLWTVYSVADDGVFKEAWSGDGIYARDLFLADDGIHIVCMESWPTGPLGKDDVVVAVYAQGALVKAYRTVDLIKNPTMVQRSISHYRWLAERSFVHAYGTAVSFRTIDDQSYELDMLTGKLNREEE